MALAQKRRSRRRRCAFVTARMSRSRSARRGSASTSMAQVSPGAVCWVRAMVGSGIAILVIGNTFLVAHLDLPPSIGRGGRFVLMDTARCPAQHGQERVRHALGVGLVTVLDH